MSDRRLKPGQTAYNVSSRQKKRVGQYRYPKYVDKKLAQKSSRLRPARYNAAKRQAEERLKKGLIGGAAAALLLLTVLTAHANNNKTNNSHNDYISDNNNNNERPIVEITDNVQNVIKDDEYEYGPIKDILISRPVEVEKERVYDRDDFINYLDHCEIDSYAGEKYYFLTDTMTYEMAEYAINSLNEALIKAGRKPNKDGLCLPSFITPEFICGVIMGESSQRVNKVSTGKPFGVPDDSTIEGTSKALGCLQQKDGFREDADRFLRLKLGDEIYNELLNGLDQDSVSPLISIYRALIMYDYYVDHIHNNTDYDKLYDDDTLMYAAIACYNKGQGGVNPETGEFTGFKKWMRMDLNNARNPQPGYDSLFYDYMNNSVYVMNIKKFSEEYRQFAKDNGYVKEKPSLKMKDFSGVFMEPEEFELR